MFGHDDDLDNVSDTVLGDTEQLEQLQSDQVLAPLTPVLTESGPALTAQTDIMEDDSVDAGDDLTNHVHIPLHTHIVHHTQL